MAVVYSAMGMLAKKARSRQKRGNKVKHQVCAKWTNNSSKRDKLKLKFTKRKKKKNSKLKKKGFCSFEIVGRLNLKVISNDISISCDSPVIYARNVA